MVKRFVFTAILACFALGASAKANDTTVHGNIIVDGAAILGSHSTDIARTGVHGLGGMTVLRVKRGRLSLGVDSLIASGTTVGACCRTSLSAEGFSVGYEINGAVDFRVGEYLLNQKTLFPPNTVASVQSSHLAGAFMAANVLMPHNIGLEITYAPRLFGRIATAFPIAGLVIYGDGRDERGQMVTARLLFGGNGKHVHLVYGIQAIDFVAHYENGQLADQNRGVVPFIGVSVPI